MNRHPAVRHPDPERLERLALGTAGRGARALGKHVEGCARCRQEVEDLRGLDAALSGLPVLKPSADFADRVMARIRLPAPPNVRLRAWLRERRAALIAGLAGAATSIGVGVAVLVQFPGVRPATVVAYMAERGSSLVWQFVIQAGRVVYESGIGSLASAVRPDLTPLSALAALLTVGLMGIGALAVLVRLLRPPRAEQVRSW